jgi:uncharacterized integral membrane protein (TIGR00698 family)
VILLPKHKGIIMSYFTKENWKNTLNGVWFVALFAMSAIFLAQFPIFKNLGIHTLIIAIVLGMIYGNFLKSHFPESWTPGITFSAKLILRGAIILYGFRLTFQQIFAVGVSGLTVDLIMVVSTFLIGSIVAIKLLKLDKQTSFLTASGASICGAAAVLATEPVVKAEAHKSAIAVSTVVLFGTISMFLYPILYNSGLLPNMDLATYGIYVGATVHEVAHVVGAGVSCGMASCDTSVIIKMGRVILLIPFLLILGWYLTKSSAEGEKGTTKLVIPWFAIGFLAVAGFNSLELLPKNVVDTIIFIDDLMLAMAMAALGLSTNFAKFKEVGMKPIYAAFTMFIWLLVGGYFITLGVTSIFGSGGHAFGVG